MRRFQSTPYDTLLHACHQFHASFLISILIFIICINKLKSEFSEPLKSRCYSYNFNYSYKDKIRIIKEIAEIEGINKKVVKFIEENINDNTSNLDLRLLIKLNELWETTHDYSLMRLEVKNEKDTIRM